MTSAGPIYHVDDLTAQLAPIDLTTTNEVASLQVRTDRKYVLAPEVLGELLADLAHHARVLEIDGRRSFGYSSVYFDTPAYDTYLAAARRRPRRYKVRTRQYLDDGSCWIEVKTRTPDGTTAKFRRSHDPGRPGSLTADSRAFLSTFRQIGTTSLELDAALRTSYRRTTLVVDGARATIDSGLACHDLRAGPSEPAPGIGIGDLVIVETKSDRRPSSIDRTLWRRGHRPTRISKYALGVGSSVAHLPTNRWHRTMQLVTRS